MKRYKHKALFMMLVMGLALTCGCSSNGLCESGLTYAESVNTSTSALTALEFDGDKLGHDAYRQVETLLDKKSQFRLGVYRYSNVSSEVLIQEASLQVVRKTEKSLFAETTDWEYQFDIHTGYESAGHKKDMHAMQSVHQMQKLSDGEYLGRAWKQLENYRGEVESTKHLSIYPYKIRKYYVGMDGREDQISQVAVSVGMTLDGWPVLGPAKTAVHFSPIGEMIGYTKIHKLPSERVFELTQDDILTPEEALREAMGPNALSAPPYRMEFGYYDGGRHNVRSLISPYYVFVFHSENGSKDLVKLVSAVKNPKFKAMIENDNQAELDRKASLMDNTEGDIKND